MRRYPLPLPLLCWRRPPRPMFRRASKRLNVGVTRPFTATGCRWPSSGMPRRRPCSGGMHGIGQGVPQDDAEAAKWTRRAT